MNVIHDIPDFLFLTPVFLVLGVFMDAIHGMLIPLYLAVLILMFAYKIRTEEDE